MPNPSHEFFFPYVDSAQDIDLAPFLEIWAKGSFKNYVDKIWTLFDHLPPFVDIFYGLNVDKK